MIADNLKSGFAKCGIAPFNPDSPDYSKLEASAAQKEHGSTIFEGIDQGGYKEASSQTEYSFKINRSTQTSTTQVTTKEERMEKHR